MLSAQLSGVPHPFVIRRFDPRREPGASWNTHDAENQVRTTSNGMDSRVNARPFQLMTVASHVVVGTGSGMSTTPAQTRVDGIRGC
jgi:hypothetical protein